jgi:hypothetical protein
MVPQRRDAIVPLAFGGTRRSLGYVAKFRKMGELVLY